VFFECVCVCKHEPSQNSLSQQKHKMGDMERTQVKSEEYGNNKHKTVTIIIIIINEPINDIRCYH